METDDTFVAKATIPSPTMILRQEILSNDGSSKIKEIYPDLSDFYEDLSSTYKAAIHAFYEKGCRYLQFDDTNWAFLADQTKREALLQKELIRKKWPIFVQRLSITHWKTNQKI